MGNVGSGMSLEEITSKLGKWHAKWKEAERAKNLEKERFFNEVTQRLQDELAAQSVEKISAKDEEEALRIAQRRFHRYKVIDVRENKQGDWDVVLEENPEYKPFVYVNKEDGQVYQRVVAEGAPFLDDDSIRDENPDLWDRITEEKVTRELRPLEELDPEDIAAIQPYLTAPRPQVRFPNPRRAKPEELDEDNH